MQVFDQEIYDIVEKGLLGQGLTEEETLASLLSRANSMARRTTGVPLYF